jgi:YHS domain-containing protein
MRLYGRLRIGFLRSVALLVPLLLSGCSATMNVVSDSGDDSLMLGGHDPVAYFSAGKAVPGRHDLKATHRGVTYRFATEDARRAFISSPDRFIPQYGGFCAGRMAYAVPIPARNDQFKIIGGRLYLFSSARARLFFEMDQEKNLKLAEHYWEAEVRESNWHFQSIKRQLLRVPDFKSNDQLADEYEKRFGKRPG